TGLTGLNPLPVSLAVSNLQPQTTYYYSTFATNVAGSGTGSYLSFSTPATNALLNNLTLSAGTPSPVFASNTVSYTTIVSNEVTSLTATATLAQTNAVLKVNGTTVTSGVASSAINLIVGTNVLSVAVTAQDGVTTNLYTVSVWRYPLPPAATTLVASGITSTGATINGSVNPGGAADAYFRYGTTSNEVATVSTLAGGDTWGSADGTGTNALFRYLRGVAVDGAGNVYVADYDNNRIRKVTAEGVVTTLAGSTAGSVNGVGVAAQFSSPSAIAVDSATNLYVADASNHRIRKIALPTGPVFAQSGFTGQSALVSSNVVTGLTPETTYYYRAIGTNIAGQTVGAVLTFTTPSTNAALSALVANVGTLTPAFAAGTGTYWTGVSNGVTNMTITATVAQSNATVKVNGTTVASGTASGWISLVVGTSSIPVEVTAQDGTTITTYTVVVIREGRAPVFTTLAAGSIGSNVVTLSVSMTPYDLPTGSFFQYGTVTNLTGVTFSTLMDGVWNGMAPVAITNLVTELIPDATYYYRAGVTNRIGTNYSDILSFSTLPVNRAPELAVGITNLVATYNSAFSYTFLAGTFTDPDNNSLTYIAYGLPGGITLNSGTRTFSGTPTAAGSNWVALVASDSFLTTTNTFLFVVGKAAASVELAALSQTYSGT
ncbi:MAG: cadherin-like beta sandwich domain-containing protein, partial [Betaproteobacteria bacterium]